MCACFHAENSLFNIQLSFTLPKETGKREESSEAGADERGGVPWVFQEAFGGIGGIRSERKQNLEVKLAGKETATGNITAFETVGGAGCSLSFLF